MLSVSLLTLGDPAKVTGGYLYHRRMADAAPARDARVDFVSFPETPFPLPLLGGPTVTRRLREQAPDVVLLDSITAAYAAPWVARSPRPWVAILHQPPGGIDHGPVRSRAQAVLDRWAYRHVRLVVAASQALADLLVGKGFEPERVRVVPPGRDVAPAPAHPLPDLRAGRAAALLCVGNWVERKGILDLLEAVAPLPPGSATLHLVGDASPEPSYARRVRRRLEQPDLAGRVVVHGTVAPARVAALYAAADVFVLPSVREPYGTVYGEAMAAGLPVVGWAAGNLPHLARHGREGVVLPPGDVTGLAAALRQLVDDPHERRRLATAAQERAASFPTWEESAAALFGLLWEVAGEG